MTLRNLIVPVKNVIESLKWQLETPKDVPAGAIRDLTNAYKSNFAKKKKKNPSHNSFRLKFRTRRDPHQSIAIPKTAVKIVKN